MDRTASFVFNAQFDHSFLAFVVCIIAYCVEYVKGFLKIFSRNIKKNDMATDRYYDSAKHKRWRDAVLRRAGYLCEECRRYGRLDKDGLPVRATTAHHIKHRDEFPELQTDVSNGRALCTACHNRQHPEKGGRFY